MLDWLKVTWKAIVGAGLMFLAFKAIKQSGQMQRQAEAWDSEAQDAVNKNLDHANAALSQAKVKAAEAERIKQKAEQRISEVAKRDEEMADIIDRWRRT